MTEPNGEETRVTFDVDNESIGAILRAVSALVVRSSTAAPPSLEELFHAPLRRPNPLGMTVGSGLSALVFGAVAVVMCQVTEHGRAATGASLAVFAVAFVVRAVGDMQQQGGNALSWFSPIAWAQQMRAFVDLRWWPAALAQRRNLVSGAMSTTRREESLATKRIQLLGNRAFSIDVEVHSWQLRLRARRVIDQQPD